MRPYADLLARTLETTEAASGLDARGRLRVLYRELGAAAIARALSLADEQQRDEAAEKATLPASSPARDVAA